MSLLKWKELTKSKFELGDKINTVRNAIIQSDLGQKTSQASFSKVFQPITTKHYGIDIEDEVPGMNLGDLLKEPVLPQQEKRNFLSLQLMKNH